MRLCSGRAHILALCLALLLTSAAPHWAAAQDSAAAPTAKPVQSMGFPSTWKPYVGASLLLSNTSTGTEIGGQGLIGIHKELMNPMTGGRPSGAKRTWAAPPPASTAGAGCSSRFRSSGWPAAWTTASASTRPTSFSRCCSRPPAEGTSTPAPKYASIGSRRGTRASRSACGYRSSSATSASPGSTRSRPRYRSRTRHSRTSGSRRRSSDSLMAAVYRPGLADPEVQLLLLRRSGRDHTRSPWSVPEPARSRSRPFSTRPAPSVREDDLRIDRGRVPPGARRGLRGRTERGDSRYRRGPARCPPGRGDRVRPDHPAV